jgi:hypothetical protein
MRTNEKSIDNRNTKAWLRYIDYGRQNKWFAQSAANPAWRDSFYCFLGKIRAEAGCPDCSTSAKSVSFGHLLNDFGERRHVPALQKRLLLQNCSPTIRAATEVRCHGPSRACQRLLGLTFDTPTRSSEASLRLGKVAQQTAREPAPSGKAKTNEGPGLREGSRQQQLPLESEDTTSAQVCSKNRITFR